MQHKIKAQNIKCEGCANTIKTSLMQMNGVTAVSVDVARGMVEVETSDGVPAKQLHARLSELGYPPHASAWQTLKQLFS